VPRTRAPPRSASERAWASLSPPRTRLEKIERTSIFKYHYLHFNKQGGTKEFPHPLLLTWMGFWDLLEISQLIIRPSPYKFQHFSGSIKRSRPDVPDVSSITILAGAIDSEWTKWMHMHNLQPSAVPGPPQGLNQEEEGWKLWWRRQGPWSSWCCCTAGSCKERWQLGLHEDCWFASS
jgi:hypothetical protein